jgi:hypothetical protein
MPTSATEQQSGGPRDDAADREQILRRLRGDTELLQAIELLGPEGQIDRRKSKKLQEVAGFCQIILKYVRQFLPERDPARVAEFSCGKSYLGVVLALLLERLQGRRAELVGVDVNPGLIEKCRRVAEAAGLRNARYVAGRTLDFEWSEPVDVVVALHACDTATDEAIAKGIELGAQLILAVPCCQNQIRGQIKGGHPLTAMTQFGPVRYRLANMLTDVLRAQFLHAAGYHVKMREIGSPRLTPKNLCICARKVKNPGGRPRDEGYRRLRSLFGVKPKIEQFCPGVIGQQEQ